MKTVSAALKAHLAGSLTKRAVCLRLTRTDGTVIAATLHDRDIVFDGVTYLTAAGGDASSVEDSAALNVDNLSARGILSSLSITEADLNAGLYDYARISAFVVNWSDLSQGSYSQRDGWLGEVTLDRLTYTAQIRGMTQALQTAFGRLYNPTCDAILGDSRCTKDLTDFTVTGTIEGVSADGITVYDSARAEPGPAGSVSISAITKANPGRVMLAADLGVANGLAITLSAIGGMTQLNGVTVVRNRNIAGTEFDLGLDTTDYPTYSGGGIATPAGSEAGWFDYGLFSATSGACAGRSMEVKSYVPGQWTLVLPMPYALAIGDTYTMVAGCNKVFSTCRAKFDNQKNFRGFPYVPGQDKIAQIGRQV